MSLILKKDYELMQQQSQELLELRNGRHLERIEELEGEIKKLKTDNKLLHINLMLAHTFQLNQF